MKTVLSRVITAFFLLAVLSGALLAAHAAESKPQAKSERKDRPQIQDFTFSRKYPFRSEDQTLMSSVSFVYAYEKVEPNSSRNAFNEALEAVNTYLIGLSSTQNPNEKDVDLSIKKTLYIQETTAGGAKIPKIYSIKDAVEQSTKNKKFEIEINYWKENVSVQPDGTKVVKKTPVKTERQSLEINGDGQSAKVEIYCVECDAVQLADQLFSAH